MTGPNWGALSTIRVRLTAALVAALLPVLILGVVQSAIAFNRERIALRQNLGFAAERSAATARSRMEGAGILLQTLAPGAIGYQCADRLAEVARRIPGYANLVRFDRRGRVACAAGDVPYDPQRVLKPWFQRLQSGDQLVITRDPGATLASQPSVLAAVRAESAGPGADAPKTFDGAFAAVITLASLQPSASDPTLPAHADVALVDAGGHYISETDGKAFPALPAGWRDQVRTNGAMIWYGADARGQRRVYSAAPVAGDEVYVVLSAQSPGILSWAWLNPLSGIAFPLISFVLALGAVLWVTDRVMLRWIAYLQRIASLRPRPVLGAADPGRAGAAGDSRTGRDAGADGRRHRRARREPARQPRPEGCADARDPSPGEEQPAGHLLAAEHAATCAHRPGGARGAERHAAADHRAGADLPGLLSGTGPQPRGPAAVPGGTHRPAGDRRDQFGAAGAHRALGRAPGNRPGPPGALGAVRGRGDHQRPEARLCGPRRHADPVVQGERRRGAAGNLRRRPVRRERPDLVRRRARPDDRLRAPASRPRRSGAQRPGRSDRAADFPDPGRQPPATR